MFSFFGRQIFLYIFGWFWFLFKEAAFLDVVGFWRCRLVLNFFVGDFFLFVFTEEVYCFGECCGCFFWCLVVVFEFDVCFLCLAMLLCLGFGFGVLRLVRMFVCVSLFFVYSLQD